MTKSAPSNSLGSNWLAANKQLANQREQTNKLLNGLSNWRQLHEILLLLSDWRLETGDWRQQAKGHFPAGFSWAAA